MLWRSSDTIGSGQPSSAWPGCSRRNRRRTSTYRVGVSPVNARNSSEEGSLRIVWLN